MPQRFFGKTPHKKYVRPVSNGRIPHKIETVVEEIKKVEEVKVEEKDVQTVEQTVVEEVKETKAVNRRKNSKSAALEENKEQETVENNG